MASYDAASMQMIIDDFSAGQEKLAGVEITIQPEENTLDALEALRLYQSDRNVDNALKLATLLCVNKKVTFQTATRVLLEFTPVVGKPIHSYFAEAPYLLDIFCSLMWGILLKKLTPPSDGSVSVGGLSQ